MLSLAPGEKHGYAILKDIEALSNGETRLSVSTLYEALSRLVEQGLIKRVENNSAEEMKESRRSRKVYRISMLGLQVLEAETRRMQHLVERARHRLAVKMS